MRHASKMLLVPVGLVGIAACAASPDRPPIARIAALPTAVPDQDDFQTAVMLDGSASASLEGGPLTFAWQLLDDEVRADGRLDQPALVIHCKGERVPRIVLTVTDDGDRSGEVTLPLALTVPP